MSDQYLDERGVQKLLEALKPHIEGSGGGGGVGSVSPITNNLLAAIAKGEYVPAEALGTDLFLNTPGLDTFYRYIGPRVSGGTPVRAIAKADYMALSDLEKDADVLYILTDTTRRYPTSLDLMSWADISKISADGTFKNYFKVGDTKRIYLNGRFYSDGPTYSNIPLDLLVVGVDHNQEMESPEEHRVHWLAGTLNGSNVCLTPDPMNYGTEPDRVGGAIQQNTTVVGWKTSSMFKYVLTNTNNSFISLLPEDLSAVMKPVRKSSYTEDKKTMEFVESYVSLLSMGELVGDVTPTWNENMTQQTYEFFKNKTAVDLAWRAKYLASIDILTSSAKTYWLRTSYSNSLSWYSVAPEGTFSSLSQRRSYAIRPLVFT